MTTYADEIEEANDRAARKAHVEALFGKTKMAALMAATDGSKQQQTAERIDGKIVRLPERGDDGQQDATALS